MRVRLAIFALACLPLAAQDPPANPTLTPGKEAALGRQLAAEFSRTAAPVDSPLLNDYVRRLGDKLAAFIPDAKSPFTFSVVADEACPLQEPLGLPGGYVVVPAGLFVAAEDEAEFAGILAHAMEHIARRDWFQSADPKIGAIPLIFLGGGFGCTTGSLMPVGLLPSRRASELAADALAAGVVARAGYDPNGLGRYIARVQPQPRQPGTVAKVFTPFPSLEERLSALSESIAKLPHADSTVVTTGEFVAARQEAQHILQQTADRRLRRAGTGSAEAPSLMLKK